MENSKFSLGYVVQTLGAVAALESAQDSLQGYLQRHESGDWGVVCQDDCDANELSLKEGTRLLSAYLLSDGTKIWIFTDDDRSVTTVLLPTEYFQPLAKR